MLRMIVLSLLLVLVQSSNTPGSEHLRPEETCIWSPFSKSLKVYHFQTVGDDGSNIALRLNRDPERPTLDIGIGASWTAWLPAPWYVNDESELEIQFATVPDDGIDSWTDDSGRRVPPGMQDADGFLHVDILTAYRYVRRVRLGVGQDGVLRPNGIEIGLEEGRGKLSFAGGAYYPDDTSKRSLWDVMRKLLTEEHGPNETLPDLLHGRGRPRDDGPVPPGRDSMFGLRAEDLPQIATSLQSAASPLFSSIASGASVNIFDLTSSYSAFGVAISSVTSLTNLNQRWDDLWQMELVASEKFFDKLWCSGIFTVCPGLDDVIVPPGKECPVFE